MSHLYSAISFHADGHMLAALGEEVKGGGGNWEKRDADHRCKCGSGCHKFRLLNQVWFRPQM